MVNLLRKFCLRKDLKKSVQKHVSFVFFVLLFIQFAYAHPSIAVNGSMAVELDASMCTSYSASVFIDSTVEEFEYFAVESRAEFHIITHGKPGALLIDGQWLDTCQLSSWMEYAIDFNKVNHINIYGCISQELMEIGI